MIETLNLLLLKKFEESSWAESSDEFLDRWLRIGENQQRLQRECEKIWSHCFSDEKYQAERAFKILGQRLHGICQQEMTMNLPRDNG